jgi:hypothetical protein
LLLIAVLLVSASLLSVTPVKAQGITRFSSEDRFEIPATNGSIRFSVNGTYVSAMLDQDDMWVFKNLTLSGTRFSGNLKFSAKNCTVTIHAFRSNVIRYTVEGEGGEQVMNLGLNSSRPSHVSEWSVINQDSVFFAEGKNWQLMSDNTVVVRELSGTLTVMYYNFGYTVDERPFYLRHSIIISTWIAVLIIVTASLVIKIKTKPQLRRLS